MKGYIINIIVFILSFIIGIIIIDFTAPETQTIILYPTVDNKHLFQFRDKTNNCFQLNHKNIKCSNDVEEIPIQI
jgi:hypothetical protein|tara:strand:+ start:482 stop:706 length:225 start_codon:yes stop_codon:yes gene_type:complete